MNKFFKNNFAWFLLLVLLFEIESLYTALAVLELTM